MDGKFYFNMCFIEVYLIYDVVLISAIQQSDSFPYKYINMHSSSYSFPLQVITGY